MRMSSDPQHPDFSPIAYKAKVYLNGELLHGVLHADSDRGTATCALMDSKGLYRQRDGELMTRIRRGNVCIFIPDD